MARTFKPGETPILTLISATLLFQGCSTPPGALQTQTQTSGPSRSIASKADAEARFDVLSGTYLLGERYLKEFDAQLEKAGNSDNLLQSDIYAKLIAVRTIRESAIEELEAIDQQPVPGLNIQEFRSTVIERTKAPGLKGILARLAQKAIRNQPGDAGEWRTLSTKLKRSAFTKDWQKAIATSPVEDQVEQLAKEWRADQSLGREPQSDTKPAKIEPSSGKNGNVIGWEYPANTWSLTYDDGPATTSTDAVLAVLAKDEIKATFFQVSKMLIANPDRAKQVREAGHEFANHSWSHKNLVNFGPTTLDTEIRASAAEVQKTHGARPRFFRLPYGSGVNNSNIRRIIAEEKQIHVFWNVDSLDWQDKDPASVARRVIQQMGEQKKGVILFHDVQAHTHKASKTVIEHLKKIGARTLTMGQAVDEINASRE